MALKLRKKSNILTVQDLINDNYEGHFIIKSEPNKIFNFDLIEKGYLNVLDIGYCDFWRENNMLPSSETVTLIEILKVDIEAEESLEYNSGLSY